MSDDMDERYPSSREHWRLVERVATVEADMRQIGPTLARIETMIAARASAPAPQETAGQLALHNAADAIRALASRKGGGGDAHPILIVFALVGALAIGALGVLLLS